LKSLAWKLSGQQSTIHWKNNVFQLSVFFAWNVTGKMTFLIGSTGFKEPAQHRISTLTLNLAAWKMASS
jgi:hypothetical protein